jgi:hypothetical protein
MNDDRLFGAFALPIPKLLCFIGAINVASLVMPIARKLFA